MPTIDELPPAAAAADDDFIALSQAGAMRRVTRSQLLAGVQPALALAQGNLLGRMTTGVGGAESIAVGDNLRLWNGVLSGAPAFRVSALPASNTVGMSDTIAVSQGGRDAGLPVGTLLAELANVPGLDVSGQLVTANGSVVARSLAEWAADSVPVEAFGAVGDGFTDDTAAIDRAVANGRPVRFGARTYILNGQYTVTRAAVLIGVTGRTVLRRAVQSGGAWISVGGQSFTAIRIEFDAGLVPGESWGVLVTATCQQTRNCSPTLSLRVGWHEFRGLQANLRVLKLLGEPKVGYSAYFAGVGEQLRRPCSSDVCSTVRLAQHLEAGS